MTNMTNDKWQMKNEKWKKKKKTFKYPNLSTSCIVDSWSATLEKIVVFTSGTQKF